MFEVDEDLRTLMVSVGLVLHSAFQYADHRLLKMPVVPNVITRAGTGTGRFDRHAATSARLLEPLMSRRVSTSPITSVLM